MKEGDDKVTSASERPKRRHARPHELDSDDNDDDDDGKVDSTPLDEETIPDKSETQVPDSNAPQLQVNSNNIRKVLFIS